MSSILLSFFFLSLSLSLSGLGHGTFSLSSNPAELKKLLDLNLKGERGGAKCFDAHADACSFATLHTHTTVQQKEWNLQVLGFGDGTSTSLPQRLEMEC